MQKCCINGCDTNSKNNQELSFFRFPKNEARNLLWIKNIGEQNIKPAAAVRICSLHFEANSINRTLNVVRLKDDAVPTFFPFTSPSLQSTTALDNTITKIKIPQVDKNKLENMNKRMAAVIQKQRKKIKMLQQTCRRLKHKLHTLENKIEESGKQNSVDCDSVISLEEKADSPEYLEIYPDF